MIGIQPTGLDDFVTVARPAGIYGLNHCVPYAGVWTVRRVQNGIWGRLPDACGVDRYFETQDPIASARYELTSKTIFVQGRGNLTLLQYWGLATDTWYAPYNEWVLGDADHPDSYAKADWMNDWTCEAIRLAAADGKKLCIGSFATGEPDFDLLPNLYPMLRLAKLNGGILDLHEYGVEGPLMGSPSSGALRYRQFYNALPVDCRIPIVISEFWWGNGFEAAGNLTAQIADAKAYGMEIVKDDYLLWASAFQLDEGAESNFTPEAVHEYTHAAESVQKGSPAPMAQITGVHSRESGGDLTALDMSIIPMAGKLNGFKFTTQDARNNHGLVKALGIPSENCIVRLFWDSSGFTTIPTPEDFVSWFRLPIQEAIADGITVFELLNEPNVTSEWKWSAPEFVTFAKQVVALIRQTFATPLTILTPGLSPAANTPAWDQAFQDGGLYAACDGIGVHSYGSQPAHLNDNDQLRYYRRFATRLTGTKKIWITEASFKFYAMTPHQVGLLYGEYANTLEDYVQGVWFFILQGDAFASSGEEWVSRPDIARGLSDYVPTVPPTTQWVFEHYHLNGGAAIFDNPIMITMNQSHTLEADAIEVTAPPPEKFFLKVEVNPPGTLIVILNPPQPIDGYLAGTIVTATAVPVATVLSNEWVKKLIQELKNDQ